MPRATVVTGERRWRLLALSVVLIVLVALAVRGVGFPSLPSISNPFGTESVDRSTPPLLTSLQDLSRFEAASGTYQVVVDVEKDVKRVPSVVAGERTLYLATGSVDASVDFSGLDASTVKVSGDGKSVDIVLPQAALSPARIDPEQSRVVSRERGVLDRLGGVFSDNPTSERELNITAQDRMRDAARRSELAVRAQDNTRVMLKNLLRPLGYDQVRVTFERESRP